MITTHPNPGPFRCLGCRSFVTGTEAGHCPKCGLVPPRALLAPSVEPAIAVVRPWDLLRRLERSTVVGVAVGALWVYLRFFYQ